MTQEETITAAWYSILTGSVTVGAYTFPVYRTNAPIGEHSHYILLRKESGSFQWNKAAFFRTFVLIVEVVTRFKVIINDKLVDDADAIIKGLAMTSPTSNNLGVTGLVQVDPGSPTYIDEDDGSNKYYRKITRFVHQVASESP
jgi:hypothetical protein